MADILDEPLLPPEERPSLDIQDIMELLPHRYPFLLVDRVEWSRASKRSAIGYKGCLLYTSPSPRDRTRSRMPSSA